MLEQAKQAGASLEVPAAIRKERGEAPARWQRLARPLLFRLPIPSWLTLLGLAVFVTAEQIVEEMLLTGNIVPQGILFRVVLVGLFFYLLSAILWLKAQVVRAVPALERAAATDANEFGQLMRRLIRPRLSWELGSLLLSILVVVLLFVILDSPLPMEGSLAMAGSVPTAVMMLAAYILIGWQGLALIQTCLQHAFGLRQLARLPLAINVYDPDNLLPFGTLALYHSLALIGVIVLLIIPLGLPSGPSGLLVTGLASSASLVTLLAPIWTVFLRTRQAKEEATSAISLDLHSIQQALLGRESELSESVADLNARSNALINLRRAIREVPDWPFRSTATVARATTAALSPIIYFVLIELVRAYFVPALIR